MRWILNSAFQSTSGGKHARTKHLLLPALLWNTPSGHLYPFVSAKGRGCFLEGRNLASRIWGNSNRQKLDFTHLCTCDQTACADSQKAGKDARQLSSNPFPLALLKATEPQNWEKINKKKFKWLGHAKIEAKPSFSKDWPQLVCWDIF